MIKVNKNCKSSITRGQRFSCNFDMCLLQVNINTFCILRILVWEALLYSFILHLRESLGIPLNIKNIKKITISKFYVKDAEKKETAKLNRRSESVLTDSL